MPLQRRQTVRRTSKALGLIRRNSSQVPQIALVSDQHDDNVCIGVISQLLEPSRNVLVCLVLADIVDKKGADGTSVVCGSDGTVTLLAGCIPNLRLDGFGVNLDRSGGKLDTDSRLGVEVEFVSSESAEKIGLSDSRVSNQDN